MSIYELEAGLAAPVDEARAAGVTPDELATKMGEKCDEICYHAE